MKGRESMFTKLFSHKHYRQLEIIDYVLNQPEDIVSFTELKKEFGVADRVLKRDVREIRELCKNQLEINVFHELVSIQFKQIANFHEVFRMFARETTAFKLFDDIIFQRFDNVMDLFDQYYISRSTGYRYLNALNEFFALQDIEVEISTNPLLLTGNEIDVRSLIPNFLTMYYHVDECPFDMFDMPQIHSIFQAIASRFTYVGIFSNNRSFYYGIASNLDRTLRGHLVKSDQWQLDQSYWGFSEHKQKYPVDLILALEEVGLEPVNNKIEQLLVGICNNQMIVNETHLNLRMEQDDTFGYQVIKFYNQLDHLSQKYNIQHLTLREKNLLAIIGYNLMVVYVAPPNIFTINQQYAEGNFLNIFNELNPSFFNEVKDVIHKFLLHFGADTKIDEKSSFLFYIMAYWPDLVFQLRKHQVEPNILIFLENAAAGQQFRHFLQSTSLHQAHIHVVSNPVECNEFATRDWDIVISDHELPQMRTRYFLGVDGLPTNDHIDKVNSLVKQIRFPHELENN